MNELSETYDYLKEIGYPNVKIITAPLSGMCLASYNGRLLDNPNDQTILNDTVLGINKNITSWNEQHGQRTPWTSAIVHRYFRKKYHFSYHRLHVDGCHLSDEVKDFWAKKLAETISINK